MKNKKLIIAVLVLIAVVLGLFFATKKAHAPTIEKIAPKITYANASADLIVVDSPTPGAVVGKTFSVTGKARGSWFFEASFPIELRDKDGNVLVQIPAQAQGDWMTTDFVPFKVDLKVPDSYTGSAILVLKKDNPSGLPEHDAFILFPITIEY